MKKDTQESFIKKAIAKHGDTYTYENTKYIKSSIKISVGCKIHGDFEIRPADFIKGSGCQKCSGKFRYDTQTFIEEAKRVHNDKYTYAEVEYVNSKTKVIITCKEHGNFTQSPAQHLFGQGCVKCAGLSKSDTKTFIEKAIKIHGDKYDYTNVEYVNNHTKVKIVCKQHGEFLQTPNNHLSGYGCAECSGRTVSNKIEYISKFVDIHGDKYNYDDVNYKNNKEKIIISCPTHGKFEQIPKDHARGIGCPSCGVTLSKAEVEISEFIKSLGIKVLSNNRDMIGRHELDIVIPEHKIAIEFNGIRWHSEEFGKGKDYHKNKTDKCTEIGYRLIHIWEDEYKENKEKILSYLKHILGKSENKKVYGRKCLVVDIDRKEANIFLEKYHIQGAIVSATFKGLTYNGELVAVTGFAKGKSNTKNKGMYELVRHATSKNVIGSLGKTVKAFGEPTYTFCDDAFFTGHSYIKAGFVEVGKIAPDYKYVVNNKRQHKFLWRKEAIKNKLGLIGGTEKEMMKEAGIYRIWDCGKTRYEYRAPRKLKFIERG